MKLFAMIFFHQKKFIDLSFYPKSILNIESTIFNKQIDLIIRSND